jgi:hypothetical protein
MLRPSRGRWGGATAAARRYLPATIGGEPRAAWLDVQYPFPQYPFPQYPFPR